MNSHLPRNDSRTVDDAAVMPEILPTAVAWLGYGGLLPFIALALATLFDGHHQESWRAALIAYGAVILSFVGALHWGYAMTPNGLADRQRTACFLWSVVPALLAWSALLLPPAIAVSLLIAGFLANYWQDKRLTRRARLPAWYLPLRFRLSSIACLSLVAGGLSQAGLG